jgi:L-iditol 2-dehydrogenase
MKAARLYGPGDLRVEEVPNPEPSSDQYLIRIRACGICPSDVRGYLGLRQRRSLPATPGHEWTGEIIGAGANASGLAIGDRVAVRWLAPCGNCYFCQRQQLNLCERKHAGDARGGFAELGVASGAHLHRLPEGVSWVAASFAEPMACCLNGQDNTDIRRGDVVAIVGAGPIGLLHLQMAKAKGARTISCDLLSDRLEVARLLGADHVVDASQSDAVAQVRNLTDGHGANAVIVAVGAEQAMLAALQMAASGGTVNLFAGTYPPTTIALDPNLIHYREISLCGSWDYAPRHFTTALEMLAEGTVATAPLTSHVLPLEQTKAGFEAVASRKGMKVVIRVGG